MKDIIIDGINYNYKIDTNGNIYNSRGMLMKTYMNKGYKYIALCMSGKYKKIGIHQLLAITFIPNPNGYKLVRHLNDIRCDNNISNLAWGDYQLNVEDAKRNGVLLYGSDRGHAKLTDEQVRYIYINSDKKTTSELSNIMSISKGVVSKIQSGKKWTHITNGLIPKWRPYKNGRGMYAVS